MKYRQAPSLQTTMFYSPTPQLLFIVMREPVSMPVRAASGSFTHRDLLEKQAISPPVIFVTLFNPLPTLLHDIVKGVWSGHTGCRLL